jgi:hypothetical protein
MRRPVELGPILKRASAVAPQLVDADQVYNCRWSHAGRRPVHIHYVIQPVTKEQMDDYDAAGPTLQGAMFARGEQLDEADVERMGLRSSAVLFRLTHPTSGNLRPLVNSRWPITSSNTS